jgi:hypothetical protein
MPDVSTPVGARGLRLAALVVAGLLAAAAGVAAYRHYAADTDAPPSVYVPPAGAGDTAQQVQTFCGACHAVPPPDSFPRWAWKEQVEQGYMFFGHSGKPVYPPPIEQVIKYYEDRAPEELPPAAFTDVSTPLPVRFEKTSVPAAPGAVPTHISNVNLVHLTDERRLDVLATDMYHGLVLLLKPYEPSPTWRVLARVPNPAHTEVVDLDGDGIKDILVADLGNFTPTDATNGQVVWLRGLPDGTFKPVPLLQGVGRVADVQAADFRGTGKKDLVVAAFGWRLTGEILFLENRTTDWDHPQFVRHVLDDRHGAIHLPVADLNGDGKPDFVALISQEHETVVAFLNEGGGKFRKETIFTGPHPAYGSSGIQLVDLDGDGDLDVLYTNGDVLDKPYLLKPYHSIQWLENPGNGKYPWAHHPLTPMYGVHRAVAADFTGSGKKEIVAVGFLPAEGFPRRVEQKLDAVIFLEQLAPGKFVRHSLEAGTCDHVTCAVGDVFGTGRQDLVIGNFTMDKGSPALTIWKNLGPVDGSPKSGVSRRPEAGP